jgi:HIP---CoA ligase
MSGSDGTLRPGAVLTEQDVIANTKEHLANFKTPRSVAFLDTLPRNPGGKVVKPLLRGERSDGENKREMNR